MSTIELLFLGIGVLLLVMAFQLSGLASLIRALAVGLGSDSSKAQEQRDQLIQHLDELKEHTNEVRSHMDDIAQVMRIIEKYKLPSRSERKELDEIMMENEMYKMLSEPREPKA